MILEKFLLVYLSKAKIKIRAKVRAQKIKKVQARIRAGLAT